MVYLKKQIECIDMKEKRKLKFKNERFNYKQLSNYLMKKFIVSEKECKEKSLCVILTFIEKLDDECWNLLKQMNNDNRLRNKLMKTNLIKCGIVRCETEVIKTFLKKFEDHCKNNAFCLMSVKICKTIVEEFK